MRVSNIPVMIGPNPVRLPERADPTAIPNTGQLYTNDVSGYTELMYQNDVGGELQITTSTAAGCFLNGTAVSLGAAAAGRVVYTAADGTLTTESAFSYAAATDTLTVGVCRVGNGGLGTPSLVVGTDNLTKGLYALATHGFGFQTNSVGRFGIIDNNLSLAAVTIFGWDGALLGSGMDLALARDAANILAQRNANNAQTFRVYGAVTGSKYAILSHDGTNAILNSSSGATRLLSTSTIEFAPQGSVSKGEMNRDEANGSLTCTLSLSATGAGTNAALAIRRATCTATSGTTGAVALGASTFQDGGTNSTTVVYAVAIEPTINYTGATRTGSVYAFYIAPINTSLPTGLNAAVAFSSTAAVGLGGMRLYGTTDETTNYVQLHQYMSATTAFLDVVGAGTQVNAGVGALQVNGNSAFSWDYSGGALRVGLFGVTPTTRPTAYTQTYATADKTHATPTVGADIGAFTDPPSAAEMALLRTFVNALKADHVDLAQLVNAVIDDLQVLGAVQ